MAALSSGHFATDFANGALPALLPFLVDRFDLSYALAGGLILASAFSSSIVQPIFGLWSDRRGATWLIPAGVALAGIGIALAADAPSYPLVALCVVFSGLGVAAFHPEGSKFAAYTSGHRRASGMSLFSIGGNLGYGLGPTLTTPLILALGLSGGWLLAVPGIAVAGVLLALVPYLERFVPEPTPPDRAVDEPDRPNAIALLLGVVAFRSVAWFGLITFVPLWEVSLGHSKASGNHLLSLMLLAGGAGTLLAGPLADWIGRRPIQLASVLALPPLILTYVVVGGVPGAIALAAARDLRDRDVRRHHGHEPGVPPASRRHGVGSLHRPVDRARRHRGGRARRHCRCHRPADGPLRGCGRARPGNRAGRAVAAHAAAPPARARAGPVVALVSRLRTKEAWCQRP
jgi:MFS transporter, FSR family, fosmidomycin resistance protein